ncbi:MAG: cytochrome c oxidase subunit 3 [Anaerolineales bacterium]|nr:cytochrome c oxidase subunit 3 [Anaerolineales bacterium]
MTDRALEFGGFTRRYINRLGLWLFIISEATIFAALLWMRFDLQGVHVPEHLNQTIGLVITSLLLVSSLTAYRAEVSHASGDRQGLLRNTLLTLVLGGVFLLGVAFEWTEAFRAFPPDGGFGSVFFLMTGMHAFHVLTGLLMLLLLYGVARDGNLPADHWGPEAVVKYWHFVDVVWVFFYPAIYLLS